MLQIVTWLDGDHAHSLVKRLQQHIVASWKNFFPGQASLDFSITKNLKLSSDLATASPALQAIAWIRNPDVFFQILTTNTDLGGVEITVHSPDGSNADKRYPYLWASQIQGLDAFVVCPYRKTRIRGAKNQLPFRHAQRNRAFVDRWNPATARSHLLQILPLTDLQIDIQDIPSEIAGRMWSSERLGELFARRIGQSVLDASFQVGINQRLAELRAGLIDFVKACEENTNRTEPSTLIKQSHRWVQVYNSRPDSGHWERGEGQFDSIDGRLMFTLDEIDLLPPAQRPPRLEFWLPQMIREHPWIAEQVARGFGSKRLRNIMTTLANRVHVRFAGELTPNDWALLHQNPQLCLERLDWNPDVFRIKDEVGERDIDQLARAGLRGAAATVISQIRSILSDDQLFFSSHRATRSDWASSLVNSAQRLRSGQTLLVPRIPRALLGGIGLTTAANVIEAEGVSKAHLLALRQLHRAD